MEYDGVLSVCVCEMTDVAEVMDTWIKVTPFYKRS